MSPSLLDLQFILLLSCIGLIRFLWPRLNGVLLGVGSSVLLIGWAAPATFLVISGITLFYLFPLHRLMKAAEERNWPANTRRIVLAAGIAGLVALLLIFKLYRHFTLPNFGGQWLHAEIATLVGFSYFIFRAISFLHIQSILKFKESSPWPLLYYTLFPSTLTSGPIQKYQDFRQQLSKPIPISRAVLAEAGYRITRGYFRKLVLAFLLDQAVHHLLATGSPNVLVSIATTGLLYLFFYFDFAGYSDIAIGFGLLLGIRVPENFRKPFQATTVSEFWRNWHITLVDWFRDHVFIPLGGMQTTRLRAAFLAFLIMVLCGLWHGLTWGLLAWGAWHGMLLFLEAVSGTKPIPPSLRHGPGYWLRVLWTNVRVAAACLFLLPASDTTVKLLRGFVTWPS